MAVCLIDAHVHLYSCFDFNHAIRQGFNNLKWYEGDKPGYDQEIHRIWLLTERYDMNMFKLLPQLNLNDFIVESDTNGRYLYVTDKAKGKILTIFPGRQLITRDRLEICALACDLALPDGCLSTRETVQHVLDKGGIAAVNWAPGKWFGKRGKIVSGLFEQFTPSELLISDTTMRPAFWSTPYLIKRARRQGFKMICGSDPLPFKGEEKWIGSYFSLVNGKWDSKKPLISLKNLLLRSDHLLKICGNRSDFLSFIKRQYKIMR